MRSDDQLEVTREVPLTYKCGVARVPHRVVIAALKHEVLNGRSACTGQLKDGRSKMGNEGEKPPQEAQRRSAAARPFEGQVARNSFERALKSFKEVRAMATKSKRVTEYTVQ